MKYLGGVTPFLTGLYLIFSKKSLNSNIYSSGLLFASGGIIGMMITSSNVTIPAHYHGSVVGVSISFMGLVYLMMKHFDYKMPKSSSLKYQPILLSVGQLLHIGGLAFAGGYGALRKHPGVSGNLKSQFGMGIMAIGGILAVIGGVIFIINSFPVLKGIFKCQKHQN
jgi:heme/copper-type cytochrome/quinol oxidase subunit 1